jgi:hypothetical protein
MALKLSQTLETGFVADYWRITRYKADFETNHYQAFLGLYASKEARKAGAKPIKLVEFIFQQGDFETITNAADTRAALYEAMKQPRIETPPLPAEQVPVNVNPFVAALDA